MTCDNLNEAGYVDGWADAQNGRPFFNFSGVDPDYISGYEYGYNKYKEKHS